MFLLRLALVLCGLGVLASLLLWVVTRDRRYLRWAGRILLISLILALFLLGLLFGGRLFAPRAL